jgi:eukaryotic-like serine/threonine-protein kinase
MYLETTVNQFPRVITFLGDDDPDQARHLALESIAKWSQQGFHVQHLTSFYGQMLIDLYNGDALGAWRRATSTWPELEKSLLMKIQHVYIDSLQYSGRSALAAARQGEPAAPLLKHVEKTARILDQQRLGWSDAFAAHLRAGIASIRGDEAGSIVLLRRAIEGFDEGGLKLYAAASRRVLGRLIGGDEGQSLIARCDDWMASQGIRAPEKMVRACVSGFPD